MARARPAAGTGHGVVVAGAGALLGGTVCVGAGGTDEPVGPGVAVVLAPVDPLGPPVGLGPELAGPPGAEPEGDGLPPGLPPDGPGEIGRASCRERVSDTV